MAPLLPSQQQSLSLTSSQQQQQQTRRISVPSSSSSSKLKLARCSVVQAGVLCAVCSVLAFYAGIVLGSSAAVTSSTSAGYSDHHDHPDSCLTQTQVQQKIVEALALQEKKFHQSAAAGGDGPNRDISPRFPKGMDRLVVGMVGVERNDFNKKFDLGVPYDPSSATNNKVLMLYTSDSALPKDPFVRREAKSNTAIPSVSAKDATENCDFLHIILQDPKGQRRQCTAILGQYEAFHIQKFMRLPEYGRLDSSKPLRLVNRGAQSSGRKSLAPPSLETSREYWTMLQTYLRHIDDLLNTLRPLTAKIAKDNTIIVQVCNFGQSELLLNFLCSTKRRGLDTSNILVFATDQETYDLVNAMGGATVVYDQEVFGDMPAKAARSYGDKIFMKMMMAKIYCVHLVSQLGYDVLFQDVDVVWYQNPLHHFHNKSLPDYNFDVYFQDDGNHALYYSPYSANTGFYYVRHNQRTVYFFNSFLMAGDLVLQSRSHQIPLVALLQEHASMYGLKIKIFSRDGDEFPGGHAYHRRKPLMMDIMQGRAHSKIFHMSWTKNKVNKHKFLQQMGEWYLQDNCTDKKLGDIYHGKQPPPKDTIVSYCCHAEPNIVCHYKDKPSKKPCKESPAIDHGGRSFWP